MRRLQITRVEGHNDLSASIDGTLDNHIVIRVGRYWAPEPVDPDTPTPGDQLIKKGDQVSVGESWPVQGCIATQTLFIFQEQRWGKNRREMPCHKQFKDNP
jgi:hypothetical protein